MEKVMITQDTLFQYITEHNIKLVRLAELTGLSEASINSCFKHQIINKGVPRSFTIQGIKNLNVAIGQLASELRQCLLTFGGDVFENQRGKIYDRALVEPIKKGVARYFNINPFLERILGWSKVKKHNTLETNTGKAHGCITREDADRINAELLSVAGYLSNVEVVPDESPAKSPAQSPTLTLPFGEGAQAQVAETKTDKKQTGKRTEVASSAYPWDDTSLPLPERSRLWREQYTGGVLLFRVNGGYTAEGDDALLLQQIDSTIVPYTNVETGLITAWMDSEQMSNILTRIIAQDKRVMFTDMYANS